MATVTIKQGDLKGVHCKTPDLEYYAFKGIPYAKPPIGRLRFKVSIHVVRETSATVAYVL